MKKTIFVLLLGSVIFSSCTKDISGRFTELEKLPADYSLNDATEDGCVIFENGDITSGDKFWDSFVEQTKAGKEAFVRYCNYYTIDDPAGYAPEYYEQIKEEYPKMYVNDLTYDGKVYVVRWFEENEEIVKEFKYMMKYTDEPESSTATYEYCTRYVLTNDNTVSWKDISYGMYSSYSSAFIDHLTVYSDYVYKDE